MIGFCYTMVQKIYTGQIISLELDEVRLPNDEMMKMEVVRHPGGAAVVALDDENRVCLLKQYRPAIDKWLWELPAGKIDDEEPPTETAKRELEEEAGCHAASWQSLGAVTSSPGVFDEIVHLYLAQQLKHVGNCSDPHEVFEIHWIDFVEALAWAADGTISDGKTLVGLYRAQQVAQTSIGIK